MLRFGQGVSTSTKKTLSRVRNATLAAIFVAVQIVTPVALLGGTASAATNTPSNPSLSQSCGLDIALVIDNSNSIGNSEMSQIKSAMTGFTNALNGTPTQFSVTRFGTSASVINNFTANVTTTNAAINGIGTGGGGTNWEDALIKAGSTFDPRADKPNLVIFASDGNPTYHNGGGNGSSTSPSDVNAAVTRANAIKSSGTRILALGIGNDLSVANLQAISGPNVNTGSVLTSDVITSDFSTLAADLATFAKQTCGGTITSKKVIDQDGNLATKNDQTPAEGWTFDINGSPSNPAASQTGISGQTEAIKVSAGTYSINEVAQAGYTLVQANCTGAANNGAQQGNAVVGVSVANEDIVSCVFFNTPARGAVQVQKKLDKDGNGTYESGNSEAQALSMFWKLDGGANTTFGGTISNVLTGSHQVTETMPAGYHFTGWYNTLNTQQSCANPAGTTLPIDVTVNSGLTTGITLCNARDTGTLKVIKKVLNSHGGVATSSAFNIHVKDGANDVAGSPAAGSVAGTNYILPTGTYAVSEDAKTGYSQLSLNCVNANQQAVAHPVVLGLGQNVTCTLINEDQAPSITITKQVVNPYGTAASVSSFPLFVGGVGVTSGVANANFNAGMYVITETQAFGYELSGISGDCVNAQGDIKLTVGVGESKNCTLTNTAIQPKLIVKKKVINDNSGTKESSDFTMTVSGNSANIANFPGSSYGTHVGLNEGAYSVGEVSHQGYTMTLVGDCSGTISIGQVKTCVVINDDIANPSIQVVKSGPATAYENDVVFYNFAVTNTGDTALNNVTLKDDIAVNEWCPATSLAVGETMYCTAGYTIPSPQIDNVVNTATVTGTDPDDTTVTDTDTHTLDVLHNSIKVVKSGPATATAGSKVTYTFTVTNTGDEALGDVTASDDIAGNGSYVSGDVNFNDKLDLSETWIFTADYVIPANQVTPVVNTVTTCGNPAAFEPIDWEDDLTSRRAQLVAPQKDRTVCGTDSHTTNIAVVLGSSTPTVVAPAVLAVTGQSSYTAALAVIAAVSTGLAAVAILRRKYQQQ